MKKSKVFLLIGIVLFLVMIIFVIYALNHPEASWPWDNSITYLFYLFYFIITISMFILSIVFKKSQK
jgi:uncharacterized membrane protein